jgi:nucleoside phosphorylase
MAILPLAIVTAFAPEYRAVNRWLSDRRFSAPAGFPCCQGMTPRGPVTVFQSGIGAVRFLPWWADHLMRTPYRALLVVGLAGGLQAGLPVASLLLYQRSLRFLIETPPPCDQNASIDCDSVLLEEYSRVLQSVGLPVHLGTGLTTQKIITRAEEKAHLGKSTSALAVDLESWGLLQATLSSALPTVVLRAVSDDVTMNLPDLFSTQQGEQPQFPDLRHLLVGFAHQPHRSWSLLFGSLVALRSLSLACRALLNPIHLHIDKRPGTG